jgi:hypothetical protein
LGSASRIGVKAKRGRLIMPKSMIWTEWLFSRLPFYGKGLRYQIVIRFLFVFLIWLTGLIVAVADGAFDIFIHWYQIIPLLFGSAMIVLMGAYGLTRALAKTVGSFEQLFEMEGKEYQEFEGKVMRLSGSTIAILIITFIFYFALPSGLNFGAVPATLWGVYAYFLIFIIDFIMSTGLWMGASLWITIFLISRQKFKADISSDTVEKFRGITSLTLIFAIFYYVALTATLAVPLLNADVSVLYGLLYSPLTLLIIMGAVGTLLPFYNIHNTLVSIKKKLLKGVNAEYERWQGELDAALASSGGVSVEQTMLIMSNLFRLELKDRRLRVAPEWPFDISFVSKLLAVILIPAIVRIFMDIYSRTYLIPP